VILTELPQLCDELASYVIMADAIAPTVGNVGPAPNRAPEAPIGLDASAPTFKPSSDQATSAADPTAPKPGTGAAALTSTPDVLKVPDSKPDEKKLDAAAGGAGPAVHHSPPKPVQVESMAPTPMNNATPLGGTPRPELPISPEDATGKTENKPSVTSGVEEKTIPTSSVPDADPIKDRPDAGTNGASSQPAEMAGAIPAGDSKKENQPPSAPKRKAEESTSAVNGGAAEDTPKRGGKKIKIDESKADKQRKDDKPKKSLGKRAKRIAEQIVGKTQRKTRSQGNPDA